VPAGPSATHFTRPEFAASLHPIRAPASICMGFASGSPPDRTDLNHRAGTVWYPHQHGVCALIDRILRQRT